MCQNQFLLPAGEYAGVNCPFCGGYVLTQPSTASSYQQPAPSPYDLATYATDDFSAIETTQRSRGLWITLGLLAGGFVLVFGLFPCGGLFYLLYARSPQVVVEPSVAPVQTPTRPTPVAPLAPPTKEVKSPPRLVEAEAFDPVKVESNLPREKVIAPPLGSVAKGADVIAEFPKMGWGVKSLEFSTDNRFIFVGKSDDAIQVFDLQKKSRVGDYQDLDALGDIGVLAVTPDGKKLLSGGYTGLIEIWQIAGDGSLTSAGRFAGHNSDIKSIAISPDGKFALSGEQKSRARMWEIETQREVLAIADFGSAVDGVCFTPDGRQAYAADRNTLVHVDVAKREVSNRRKYAQSYAHAIRFSGDRKLLAYSEGSKMRLYATADASEICELPGRSGINWVLAFHPDGKHLFAGSNNVKIWNVESRSIVHEIDIEKYVNIQSLAISRDGAIFSAMSSNAGATLRVYKSPIPAIKIK
jgi:WD40 repeat protein